METFRQKNTLKGFFWVFVLSWCGELRNLGGHQTGRVSISDSNNNPVARSLTENDSCLSRGAFPVIWPLRCAKHWPCDLCSWPLTCDVDPLSRGMGLLYISTGRLHWLPARHLLWEMKPKRMPLLGAFWARQTTRPGFSPACEWALSGRGKPISLIIYWKNILFPCPVITLISIAEK